MYISVLVPKDISKLHFTSFYKLRSISECSCVGEEYDCLTDAVRYTKNECFLFTFPENMLVVKNGEILLLKRVSRRKKS